jgi:amino acid transporter
MEKAQSRGHGFGTFPVFLAAISTILGAIMFLRFGWAVGNVGVWGALGIVLVGHAITIPTALAISEIATNKKVEGGGEYYIISRSFGTNIGAAIGISLYISQAISVAFYLIAFSLAFKPFYPAIESVIGFKPIGQMFSIPMAIILSLLVIKKGASMGVVLLRIVVAILTLSLIMFFLGGHWNFANLKGTMNFPKTGTSWVVAFAVCFPAFTGMTAGVGLSGDLKNPKRSIPLGTLLATLFGALVYVLIILKLGMNGTHKQLAGDELFMAQVATWGPIIFIGLAAATLSSAIGSLLIAPRTLQALTGDKVFPSQKVNGWLNKGKGEANEPLNATYITLVIAFVVIILGDVNMVAKIVSQFFMVTYGALCLISVLEHFAASPSYRPSFKSRWWISLIGTIGCFTMMLLMEVFAALFALAVMLLIYISVRRTNKNDDRGVAMLFKGALFQIIRKLQIWMQKNRTQIKGTDWRPSFIAISGDTFKRISSFDLLRWIAHRHGFGTYFHYIKGMLSKGSKKQATEDLNRIIQLTDTSKAGIYAGTIISPSFITAVAQIIQIPGVSGMDNNGIIFEFSKEEMDDSETMKNILTGVQIALTSDFNICVLRSSEYRCGFKTTIHLWLTKKQLANSNLMILLAYIIMGHPDWKNCELSVFAAAHEEELELQKENLYDLIHTGRIPISKKNIQVLPYKNYDFYENLVEEYSLEANLVIMGFTPKQFRAYGRNTFTKFSKLKDIIFVRAEEDDIALIEYVDEDHDEEKDNEFENFEKKTEIMKKDDKTEEDDSKKLPKVVNSENLLKKKPPELEE